MWTKTYSETFENVTLKSIWKVWTDTDNWHKWDPDIEYCQLTDPFAVGSYFILKPKGAPKVKIQLLEVEKERKYTDCTHLFGAKMYGIHTVDRQKSGVTLTVTLQITGPLGFFWRKILGENIMKTMAQQTHNLVNLARDLES